MNRAIQHRGPDAEGYYHEDSSGVGLGHRRLSIIDLSEAANQPFYSQSGRYVMVFNGEVFNYQAVAKQYNIPTKTSSDTEVVLEMFVRKGPECVHDFNGMFAIAVWDKETRKLYLVLLSRWAKFCLCFREQGAQKTHPQPGPRRGEYQGFPVLGIRARRTLGLQMGKTPGSWPLA